MKTTLRVYANSDDALLLWSSDQLDAGVRGFAIQRKLKRGQAPLKTGWLDNFAQPGRDPHQRGVLQSSAQWPFRSFTWTDHSVSAGDTVRYRAVPVLEGASGPSIELASAWSDSKKIGVPATARYKAFFNRGFVISQFMSRYLDQHYPNLSRTKALKQFKKDITGKLEDRLRAFLSGDVRTSLLALLDEVRRGDGHVHAALFELGDEELVRALEKLGTRAHLVLANGSIQVKTDKKTGKATETSPEARMRDENDLARKRLIKSKADVSVVARFVSPGALAHNKFLVVTSVSGQAKKLWTGSTNWTTTGLCTQLNNALLVNDAEVADAYLKQWQALRDAASAHPAALAALNGQATAVGGATPGTLRASVQFTRTQKRVDLAELGKIVRSAKEGVLFLMFIPGGSGVLADVRALAAAKPNLLVRGVVSELPKGRQDEKTGSTTTLKVTIIGAPSANIDGTRTFDVVQPEGKAHPTAWWAAETTRAQFLNSIGHAIIHSKVIVVDPFSTDPTVVTGSHNFSISASEKNDENYIVVRGDRPLAEAYAVNVQAAWRHYASRVGNPHPTLSGLPYLRALLADQRPEEHFWRLTT
jgi:phosphatidylserine/phosphatidylglycerophosphate/cardiolipin synthase-like enzyme